MHCEVGGRAPRILSTSIPCGGDAVSIRPIAVALLLRANGIRYLARKAVLRATPLAKVVLMIVCVLGVGAMDFARGV